MNAPSSFYVRRQLDERVGWVGPIRSSAQADREVAAWAEAGWTAAKFPNTPEIRAEVRAWEKARKR